MYFVVLYVSVLPFYYLRYLIKFSMHLATLSYIFFIHYLSITNVSHSLIKIVGFKRWCIVLVLLPVLNICRNLIPMKVFLKKNNRIFIHLKHPQLRIHHNHQLAVPMTSCIRSFLWLALHLLFTNSLHKVIGSGYLFVVYLILFHFCISKKKKLKIILYYFFWIKHINIATNKYVVNALRMNLNAVRPKVQNSLCLRLNF